MEKSLEQNINELQNFVDASPAEEIRKEYPEALKENEVIVTQDSELPCVPSIIDLDDPRAILNKQLQSILEIIEIAKQKAREDTRGGKVYPLTTLIETAQNLIADIDRLKDSQELSMLILKQIVQPLIKQMYKVMTVELNKVLNEMVKYVEPSNINIINHTFNQALIGIGTQTDVIYEDIKPKITEILTMDAGASKDLIRRKGI